MTASPNKASPGIAPAAHAFARAWEAFHLYGGDHPAARGQLAEFESATRSLREPIRLAVEPTGLVFNRELLEPPALFASLAEALCRGGIGLLEIRGAVTAEGARKFLQAMGSMSAVGSLEERIRELERQCGGGVRLQPFSATGIGGKAAVVAPDRGAKKESIRLSDLTEQRASLAGVSDRAAARSDAGSGASDAVGDVLSAVRSGALSKSGESEGKGMNGLQSLEASVGRLDADQRRQLVEALSTDPTVEFGDASKLLTMLPVSCVREAAAVLERPDATLNETSLMLLRRLSRLAAGDAEQMSRLGAVASQWASDAREVAGREASGAAGLLDQLSKAGEYRSEDYTELLGALAGEAPAETEFLAQDFHDESINASARALEVCLETLEAAEVDEEQAAAVFPRLVGFGGEVAANGEIGLVERLLDAFRTESERGDGKRALAARRAAEQAGREGWLATSLGRCGRAEAVIEALRPLVASDRSAAASLMVRAAELAVTEGDRAALFAGLRLVEGRELDAAVQRRLIAGPTEMSGLVPLMDRAFGARGPLVLMSVVCHEDVGVRLRAYELLGLMSAAWPIDLSLRGLCEAEEGTRLRAIERIGVNDEAARTALIERLSGLLGSAAVTRAEVRAIARRLGEREDPSRVLASALVRQAIRGAHSEASHELCDLVRSRNGTAMGCLALTVHYARTRRWFKGKGARRNAA